MEPCELGNLPAETIVELLPDDHLSDRSQPDLLGLRREMKRPRPGSRVAAIRRALPPP